MVGKIGCSNSDSRAPARYISLLQQNPLLPFNDGKVGCLGDWRMSLRATGKTAGPDIPPVPLAGIGFWFLKVKSAYRVLIMVRPLASSLRLWRW